MTFEGSYVALITPFKNDGTIDEDKIRELVNYHIKSGTAGIVPCGTTGESPTLSHEEHEEVIRIVVDEVKGQIPVIAGAGSNNTKRAIELTKFAKKVGADAVLSTCPYYNKPTQEGLFAHYKAIIDEAKFPIVLYNVPGRTGINIEPETIAKLSQYNEIVAVKEASGEIERSIRIKSLCGDKLDILSGEDHLILPLLSIGAKGVISVVANFQAKEMSDLIKSYLSEDYNTAFSLHQKLYEISTNMFVEGNPVTIKGVMKMVGMIDNDSVRLPLVQMEQSSKEHLMSLLRKKKIL